jgi:hypothetical protein
MTNFDTYLNCRLLISFNNLNDYKLKEFTIAFCKYLKSKNKLIYLFYDKEKYSYLNKYNKMYYKNNYNLYINYFINADTYEYAFIYNKPYSERLNFKVLHMVDLALDLKYIKNNTYYFKVIKNRYSNLEDIEINLTHFYRHSKLKHILCQE